MPRWTEDLPRRTFKAGEVVFRQGDHSAGEAYLVRDGKLEVRRRIRGDDRVLRTIVAGDLLGEVALFRDGPHSATAIAIEPTTVLVLTSERLEGMIRRNPRLAVALIRQLARMAGATPDAS